jgi:hypothetical protein
MISSPWEYVEYIKLDLPFKSAFKVLELEKKCAKASIAGFKLLKNLKTCQKRNFQGQNEGWKFYFKGSTGPGLGFRVS